MKAAGVVVLFAVGCVLGFVSAQLRYKPYAIADEHSGVVVNAAISQTDAKASASVEPTRRIAGVGTLLTEIETSVDLDFRGLAQRVDSISDPRERAWLREALIRKWVKVNAVAALEYCETIKDWNERRAFTRFAAREWGRADSRSAVAWLGTLTVGRRQQELTQSVIDGVADTAPLEACRLTSDLQSSNHTMLAVQAIADRVAALGPDAVKAATAMFPTGGLRDFVLRSFLEAFAASSPADALSLAGEITSNPDIRLSVASSAYAYWAARNPDEALRSLQTLSPDLKATASQSTFMAITRDSPARAAELLDAARDDADRDMMARVLSKEWGANDPSGAVEWLKSHELLGTETVVRNVFYPLAQAQRADAINAAMSLKSPDVRDVALSVIADRLAYDSPDLAAQTVSVMRSGDVKLRTMRNVINRVMSYDRAQAKRLAAQFNIN